MKMDISSRRDHKSKAERWCVSSLEQCLAQHRVQKTLVEGIDSQLSSSGHIEGREPEHGKTGWKFVPKSGFRNLIHCSRDG